MNLTLTLFLPLFFKFAKSNIPKQEGTKGDDVLSGSESFLTVADGVGGWAKQGVNPRNYPLKLVKVMKELFADSPAKYSKSPSELVRDAYPQVKHNGSTTLVLATIDNEESQLRLANLGDAGYVVLRRNSEGQFEIQLKSREKMHSFNFPFQLGVNQDGPDEMVEEGFEAKEGDLVLLASDGIFDNLFDAEIVRISNEFGEDLQKLAEVLAGRAKTLSEDKDFESPFAVNAMKNGYYNLGGKPDDISVIVAEVNRRGSGHRLVV